MGNGNVYRIKVLIASLVAVIAAMADIYVIVNAPHNYVLLGVTSLILLLAVYFIISGKMQLRDWSNLKREEEYNELITAQKACYLQVRRSFRETGGKIAELDKKIEPLATAGEVNHQKISGLLDALMQDQKKVAKLTVSRSKENANAIMNSNDKVIEEMLKMKTTMDDIVQQVGGESDNNQSEGFTKVEEGQQELLAKMQQLEDTLKNQLEGVTDKLQEMPEMERELISEIKSEIREESVKVRPELMTEEEMIPEVELEPEEIIPEIKLEPIEEVALDDIMPEEPELALDDIVPEEPELALDDIVPEEPELALDDIVPEESELALDDTISEEPESEVKDSNAMMTPEEIAALIAGAEEEALPDTIEEPVEEEPVAEEKSDIVNFSDSNKKMTPEEIAALIANM